ncbi:adenylate/guanylate cyclase domain-containing protein [Roseobacter sp.]|uniref:adenylate/guanylate cyclase domain-containing protein n=1 Tax=Roseobacter sp. TaxID=1907202 RepID=UPI0025FC205F|nr:adenylate/guanylate cyclase domain-containing protein [Roseobacter sp.]
MQIHLSNPTPNFEKLGIEHSALDALMAAARDGFETAGREGLASVMFTDVVDSSALADLVGDRLWTLKVNAHLDMVTDTVTRHGGTLVKSLGDGTMSTFPTARAALDAALSLQQSCLSDSTEPALQLRVGIHTGEVIENKGDFFGTVVNKAARIAASAAPDEIRLSDATRILLGRSVCYAFADAVDVPLKGLSGMHKTFRLERSSES